MIDRITEIEEKAKKKPDINIVKTLFEAYEKDLSVIPVSLDKQPLIKWKEYQHRKPTREEMFLWETEAEGVAIVTGKINGIVILDVDMDKGNGFKALKDKELPPTPVVRTQNGGFHYYFKYPKNAKKVKSTTDILGEGSHVDIRGDGGYALIPYTKGYEWVDSLSPEDVPIAEMPSWLVNLVVDKDTAPTKKDSPKRVKLVNEYSFTCYTPENISNVQQTGNLKRGGLLEWYEQEQVAERFLQALGISANIGQSFNCILPGHEEKSGSASIYKSDKGLYVYRDWHKRDGKEIFLLPEVFADIHYGKVVELGKSEFTTWAIRLLVDLGFVSQYPIKKKPLPKDVRPTVKKVYEGFCLLLGCKWLYSPDEPTPFSWRFARAWCGVSERKAGESIKYLLKHDYIRIVKKERLKGRETALFTITE